VIPEIGTLPAFATTMLYSIGVDVLDAAAVAFLVTVSFGIAGRLVVASVDALMGSPTGGVPEAVAVLSTFPASMSSGVTS